jgi:hypothetical protein
LTCLASVALAACPAASDLGNGIVLRTAGGNTELHRRAAEDMIRITVRFPDGDGSVLDMKHGIYMTRIVDIAQGVVKLGTAENLMSPRAMRQWPRPQRSASWTNTARDGGGAARSGGGKRVRIGGCGYTGFDVALRYADDPAYVETYTYLPELGIALLVASDDGQTRESYRYVSIAKK